MEVNEAPSQVMNLIERYFNLRIGGTNVKAPYYRNVERVRGALRSLVGKGTPEEMEEETLIYAKLKDVQLQDRQPTEIREFMKSQGIGIDCSGYAYHIYVTWLKALGRGKLWSKFSQPHQSLYRKFVLARRPAENISSEMLTNDQNVVKVSLGEVVPGDAIRSKGIKRGNHILIVTKVDYENGIPQRIYYTHSIDQYGDNNGVQTGAIEITDINAELKDQNWLPRDENGTCPELQGLLNQYEDNGLRRPNFMKDINGESTA